VTEMDFQHKPEASTLRLFLVRHGETNSNLNRVLQGVSNGILNDNGWQQVEKLGGHLQNVALDHVYSSDLQRAMDTAYAVAQAHELEVESDSQLREWDVGELDGQPAALFLKMIKDSGKPLSHFQPPGGQTLNEMRVRVEGVVRRLVESHLGQAVLIVSHGDFMRLMVGSMLGIDTDTAAAFHFNNASYSVFEYTDRHWKVIALNRIATDCE